MFRRVLYIAPLILFAALAGYLGFGLTRDARVLPSALIDKPVPEFDLPPLFPGESGFATADLMGKVAVVNVFASWCVPCRAEHPLWLRFVKEQKIPLYGLNWKDKREDAISWIRELGNPYVRIGHDVNNEAGIEWGVYGVPETYIIDRTGRIRKKHVGPIFPEILEKEILPLIRDLQGSEQ
jgi:cytochrome c biogenesis protein CcmG/thiol:disulfide interchange protein DsbE